MTDVEAYYDDLSEIYPEIARFPIREHATWPGTRSLLGDVEGERLLDAGCGSGEHSAELAGDGAAVVGVDLSEAMLDRAREQFAKRTFAGSLSFERADMRAGFPFEDGEFDVVLCQLVCSHVRDLDPLFAEFARVLAECGRLVVATHHPFCEFQEAKRREPLGVDVGDTNDIDPVIEPERHPPVYHEDETVRVSRSEESRDAEYYRRSLSTLVSALLDAGFWVDGIEEPVPDEDFRERWPEAYEDLVTQPPQMLCLRGRV